MSNYHNSMNLLPFLMATAQDSIAGPSLRPNRNISCGSAVIGRYLEEWAKNSSLQEMRGRLHDFTLDQSNTSPTTNLGLI